MDPFTERMLERARARREKLNVQLDGIGQLNANTKKSPRSIKIINDPEPKLCTAKLMDSDDSQSCKIEIATPKITSLEENSDRNKENTALECQEVNLKSSARSRLKQLGVLYSNNSEINDPEEMPSPIHRSEQKAYQGEASPKRKAPVHTVQRLAALADHINHWEDDVNHPKGVAEVTQGGKPLVDCAPVKKVTVRSAGQGLKKAAVDGKPPASDKPLQWDREVIANLESQGFRPSTSGSRLVYDYANDSAPAGCPRNAAESPCVSPGVSVNRAGGKSVEEGPCQQYQVANESDENDMERVWCNMKGYSDRSLFVCSFNRPPDSNTNVLIKLNGQMTTLSYKHSNSIVVITENAAKKLTPKQTPAHGSVLHKAALFESPSRSPKAKDPAELSVAERKALFEKNKGQALVPKAAFSMSVPLKQLSSSPQKVAPKCHLPVKKPVVSEGNCLKPALELPQTSVSAPKIVPPQPETQEVCAYSSAAASKVLDRRNIFEKGKPIQSLENDILKSVKSERQRELEMLANRWNIQREATTKANTATKPPEQAPIQLNGSQASKMVPPPTPPPLPTFSTPPPGRQGLPAKGGPFASLPSSPAASNLPPTSPHSEKISSLANVRKIKVSQAKPGCLYPSLSDIDATESEMDVEDSEGENESFGDLEDESDEGDYSSSNNGSVGAGDTSFGREIFQAAGINESFGKKSQGGALSTAEKAVFDEMDELLDEAIAEEEGAIDGPTPPKRKSADNSMPGRNLSKGKGVCAAAFAEAGDPKQHLNQHANSSSWAKQEDEHPLPLMHTISFYRKQQAQASPCANVSNYVSRGKGRSQVSHGSASQDSEQAVQGKMKSLLEEVSRQQTIISQASQALNLCSSTVEFSESAEQVEGERLLLIATHRRQAALNEIQRIKVEGTLWPKQSAESDMSTQALEKGDLDISDVTLPLKKEFLQKVVNGEVDFTHHFVCLVKHQEKVIATEMLSTANICRSQSRLISSLHFSKGIRLSGLYSDFKVTLEVYGLQVRREVLSHEAKYHIRKESSRNRITPKKLLKQESNLIMPIVQSPAGPLAVRSTAFALAGYVVFSLRELNRVQWTLNKVPYSSPLEGVVQMKLKCQLEQNAEERGFLTMFEDISGFGAWHRRWCLLHEDRLSFWKYPEDERKKEPIGWVNLNACSNESVGPVPRHICARPNTFLLETRRAALPEDRDSLVLVTSSTFTTIRHLLSADSKEERQVWCSQINKAIRSLRAWGPRV
ncbi:anillin-like [Hetaerina americana]|uniref:anillin-like n=1 Tax=Hetaerina americana TaxID=62018 RepID=UPI003A7F41AE